MIMRRRILIGTCVALGQVMCLDLPRGHYSHIFIDEAGQATEPEIIIPLCKYKVKILFDLPAASVILILPHKT